MTKKDDVDFKNSTKCWIWDNVYVDGNIKVKGHWLYVLIMSLTRFKVNLHSIAGWMSRNSLLEIGAIYEVKVTATVFEPTTT